MIMMDECVGHMMEKVVIPPADQIEIAAAPVHEARRRTSTSPTSRGQDLFPTCSRPATGTGSTSPG